MMNSIKQYFSFKNMFILMLTTDNKLIGLYLEQSISDKNNSYYKN